MVRILITSGMNRSCISRRDAVVNAAIAAAIAPTGLDHHLWGRMGNRY